MSASVSPAVPEIDISTPAEIAALAILQWGGRVAGGGASPSQCCRVAFWREEPDADREDKQDFGGVSAQVLDQGLSVEVLSLSRVGDRAFGLFQDLGEEAKRVSGGVFPGEFFHSFIACGDQGLAK